MAHKDSINSSFKVTISRKNVEKVFDEGFWPVGIGCCFFQKQRKVNNNNDLKVNEIEHS